MCSLSAVGIEATHALGDPLMAAIFGASRKLQPLTEDHFSTLGKGKKGSGVVPHPEMPAKTPGTSIDATQSTESTQ